MMQQKVRSHPKKTASNPEEIPEILSKMINAKVEEDKVILQLANEEKVALVAFIAPYVGVRVSPIEEARAFISLPDEFGVEAVVKELKTANVKKAYLLVNSPGGTMQSSYKIARAIRMCLAEIITFVPHIAASGGTLLALTGNQGDGETLTHRLTVTAQHGDAIALQSQIDAHKELCRHSAIPRISGRGATHRTVRIAWSIMRDEAAAPPSILNECARPGGRGQTVSCNGCSLKSPEVIMSRRPRPESISMIHFTRLWAEKVCALSSGRAMAYPTSFCR